MGSGGIVVGRSGQSFRSRGIVESNFIINSNFWLFLIFLVVVEVAQKLQFLSEYGELEPFKPGYYAEVFG